MTNVRRCPYDDHRVCDLWIDYQITAAALEEAEELCHGNWKEIIALRDRVDQLESILDEAGLKYPPSYI